ncbi:MAG: Uma2 family endonuclease [Sulfuricellaceae bacterium]|jgi:Uma2 family endonuclease
MGYALKKEAWISPETYLEMETASEERHEYVDGEIFAMTGAASTHNLININLLSLIREHLRGGPCRVFAIDIKLRVEAANCYFYPDLMVTCSETDRQSRSVMNEPLLVVEILPPSTALYDHNRKFAAYRQLPSLQEYVLVNAGQMGIDSYRRGEGKDWILHPYGVGESVVLHSLNLTFPVEEAYRDVEFLSP